jgi:hypothetical protein
MNVFHNHPAFILTSVNAEQLKQVGYEKDRIIDKRADFFRKGHAVLFRRCLYNGLRNSL